MLERASAAVQAAASWIILRMPERWRWTIWRLLTLQAVHDYGPPPQTWPLEHDKLVGLVRWWTLNLDEPRPSWKDLERWANLDDPATRTLRMEDVESQAPHLERLK